MVGSHYRKPPEKARAHRLKETLETEPNSPESHQPVVTEGLISPPKHMLPGQYYKASSSLVLSPRHGSIQHQNPLKAECETQPAMRHGKQVLLNWFLQSFSLLHSACPMPLSKASLNKLSRGVLLHSNELKRNKMLLKGAG